MGGLVRQIWRVVARSLGLLATLSAAQSCAIQWWFEDEKNIGVLYAPQRAIIPITAAQYQPPSPVPTGTVLIFMVEVPHGVIQEAEAQLHGPAGWQSAALHDDGVAPDAAAGDRLYSGSLEWKAEYGTGEIPVHISIEGTLDGRWGNGDAVLPTLTVLP